MDLGSFHKGNDFGVCSFKRKVSTYGDEEQTFQAEEQQNQRTSVSVFSRVARTLAGSWEELGIATETRLLRPKGLRSQAFVLSDCSPQFSRGAPPGRMPETDNSEKVFAYGHVAHSRIKSARK